MAAAHNIQDILNPNSHNINPNSTMEGVLSHTTSSVGEVLSRFFDDFLAEKMWCAFVIAWQCVTVLQCHVIVDGLSTLPALWAVENATPTSRGPPEAVRMSLGVCPGANSKRISPGIHFSDRKRSETRSLPLSLKITSHNSGCAHIYESA